MRLSVKRRPEMDTNGFYGDTFSSGFGDFYTAKKREEAKAYGVETPFSQAEKFYRREAGLTGWENSKYKVTVQSPVISSLKHTFIHYGFTFSETDGNGH